MIDEIYRLYEKEMEQVLPYSWDFWGAMRMVGVCVMVVLCGAAFAVLMWGI